MEKPPLSSFTQAMLTPYTFPGTDAAVVFIPDGEKPSQEMREVLERSGQQRWYPAPGGHQAKIPWHLSKGHESLFEREEKGWDHEHCDFCNAHVNIGDVCWTADIPGGGFWLFCGGCYKKLNMD